MDLILPDVNVLVYAYREAAPEHARYAQWLQDARQHSLLALAEIVLLGVVRVATDHRIYPRAAPVAHALGFCDALLASPGCRRLQATTSTWQRFAAIIAGDPGVRGKLVPDAWLAALALSHGARLATADRGFARFDGLDFFDPIRG